MERPKVQNYDPINGLGAYDYIMDVNKYMNKLEQQIKLLESMITIKKTKRIIESYNNIGEKLLNHILETTNTKSPMITDIHIRKNSDNVIVDFMAMPSEDIYWENYSLKIPNKIFIKVINED